MTPSVFMFFIFNSSNILNINVILHIQNIDKTQITTKNTLIKYVFIIDDDKIAFEIRTCYIESVFVIVVWVLSKKFSINISHAFSVVLNVINL